MDQISSIELFKKRVRPYVGALCDLTEGKEVYVAGGIFIPGDFGDIDIWFRRGDKPSYEFKQGKAFGCELILTTNNAYTLRYQDLKIQICRQWVDSLESLLDGFDLGICQIGARVSFQAPDIINVHDFKETIDRINAIRFRYLNYRKSASPGITLIRAVKYIRRLGDWLSLNDVRNDVLLIVLDMVCTSLRDSKTVFNKDLWSEIVEGKSLPIQTLDRVLMELHKLNVLGVLKED